MKERVVRNSAERGILEDEVLAGIVAAMIEVEIEEDLAVATAAETEEDLVVEETEIENVQQCTRRYAAIVARNVKFLFNQQATSRFTVVNATVKSDRIVNSILSV